MTAIPTSPPPPWLTTPKRSDSPLQRDCIAQEPNIIRFYADLATKDPQFRASLFGYIERSKQSVEAAIAAANSITILNAARIPFSGMDLKKIRVPGANLPGVIFDGTNLEDADTTNVNLKNAFLRKCNLNRAQMEGVTFGQRPYLKHYREIKCMVISSDSNFLAVCCDESVYLWEPTTHKYLGELVGHTGCIWCCAFSPVDNTLSTGSMDKTIRFWDPKTRSTLKVLERSDIHSCAFSPNGKFFATTYGIYGGVEILDPKDGAPLHNLEGHSELVRWCAFSTDSTLFATTSLDKTVRLWDPETGKPIGILQGHTYGVASCDFSLDGKWIASSSSVGGEAFLWELQTINTSPQNPVPIYHPKTKIKCSNSELNSCKFSPDSKLLALAGGCSGAHLWDLETEIMRPSLKGYTNDVNYCAFLSNGKELATSESYDGDVGIWNIETNDSATVSECNTSPITSCTWSLSEKLIATLGRLDNRILFWDLQTGRHLRSLNTPSIANSCALSPNSNFLAIADDDGGLQLWNFQTQETRKSVDRQMTYQYTDYNSCTFSPNGNLIAITSLRLTNPSVLSLWDVKTMKLVDSISGNISSCAFSPDSSLLATTDSSETEITLRDLLEKKVLKKFSSKTVFDTCAFSSNGKFLAGAGQDTSVAWNQAEHLIEIWDLEKETMVMLLKGHTKKINCCAFAPNDHLLATAGNDSTIRLWDMETQKAAATIEGHKGKVSIVAFFSSGKTLLSAGEDKSVRLWNLYDKDDQLNPSLLWTTTPLFSAHGTMLEDVQGLSNMNRTLLEQHGAKANPVEPKS